MLPHAVAKGLAWQRFLEAAILNSVTYVTELRKKDFSPFSTESLIQRNNRPDGDKEEYRNRHVSRKKRVGECPRGTEEAYA